MEIYIINHALSGILVASFCLFIGIHDESFRKVLHFSLSKTTNNNFKKENEPAHQLDTKNIKQATKDSVRSIMLVRAYRIRGHLIANLDPLELQKKKVSLLLYQKPHLSFF